VPTDERMRGGQSKVDEGATSVAAWMKNQIRACSFGWWLTAGAGLF
jgi:hypothetical protein